ncbi:MAG: hypothetical protein WC519_00025 [Parcubacteria group bacterium]
MADNLPTSMTVNAPSRSLVPWKALTFSAVIFGLSLIIYAGLAFGYKPFVSASIKSAEARIAELDKVAPQGEAEAEFIQFYSQLTNIKSLLSSHIGITSFLNTLSANTMPNVGFSGATINVTGRMVNMTGFADTFETLAGQLAAYENVQNLRKVTLSNARVADNVIRFELRLDAFPDLFKFVPPVQPQIEQPINENETTPPQS